MKYRAAYGIGLILPDVCFSPEQIRYTVTRITCPQAGSHVNIHCRVFQ